MNNGSESSELIERPPNKVGVAGFIISLVSIFGCGLLSIVGVIVSLIGLKNKPRGLAIAGVFISILTAGLWVFAAVLIYQGVIMGIQMTQKPLQVAVWEHAQWVAGEYGDQEYIGDSGTLPIPPDILDTRDFQVKSFTSAPTMAFETTWKRDGEDLLFTVAPVNPPPGEDVPSATLRVLPGGIVVADFKTMRKMLASNANTWLGAMMGPIAEGVLDQLEGDVKTIMDWKANNGGKLPLDAVALEILPTMPRTTNLKTSGKVTMTSLTYIRISDFLFELDFTFTGRNAQTSVTMSSSITFTNEGLVVDPVTALDYIGGF